jgi:hypothetical protein
LVPRSSEEEILEFAEWVFSSDGLRSLLILAYGDFTDRQEAISYIFCRESVGACGMTFRKFSRKDEYLWDYIPGGVSMLTSCRGYVAAF